MSGVLEQAIEKAIAAHVDRLRFAQIISGTATEVGETTCTVVRDDAPELTDVRLNAIDDDLQSHFTVYPKENSSVVVGILEGIKTEAIVLICSEVERVSFKTGNSTFVFDSSGLKLNGTEIVGWINKVYSDMQTLKALLQSSPIAGNGAPAAIVFSPTVTQIQ
ncbi:MAG: hypothetical protein PHP99_09140 [Paludibacter sp.]|nr:hypothetical protein [Paludibacter sp.]